MIRQVGVSKYTGQLSMGPLKGYYWELYSMVAVLQTGTGSGTRSMQIYVNRGINVLTTPLDAGEEIGSTGNQTATSTDYPFLFGDTANLRYPNVGSAPVFTAYYPLLITPGDAIESSNTLITGDTYSVIAVVDEVKDE